METIHERGDDASETSDSSSTLTTDLSRTIAAETSVLVVSNVLPVDLHFDEQTQQWSAEWSEDVMELGWSGNKSWESAGFRRVSHVGVPDAFVPRDQQDDVEELLESMDCYPVFLNPQEASAHYQGYVKGVLHPTFHNIIDLYNSTKVETMDSTKRGVDEEAAVKGSDKKWAKRRSWHPFLQEVAFPSHMSVTTKFARIVSQVYSDGDVVWVQDYHLLHLPSLLIRKLPKANVGLFLHQPFPSSEIFRTLSYRTEILRSMLCADHIGFHQFEYARHFLTCCRRMLGVTYTTNQTGSICVPFQGRFVTVTCCHAGVEATHLSEVLNNKKTKNDIFLQADQRDMNCKVIGSCDTAEGLSGIALKLLAFDRFLEERPRWRGQVRLLQVGITPDSRPDDAVRTENDIQTLVASINKKFTKHYKERKHPAVTYITSSKEEFTIHRRLALWQITDIFLSTCVRSGLDLHSLEYVFCRGNPITERRKKGSPFPFSNAGASFEDDEEEQKKQEKREKDNDNDNDNVNTNKQSQKDANDGKENGEEETTTTAGVVILSEFAGCCRVLQGALVVNPYSTKDVVDALDRALHMSLKERKDRRLRDMSSMYQNTRGGWVHRVLSDVMRASKKDDLIYVGTGWGLNYRIGGYGRSFVSLDVDALVDAYKCATKRLIILNYSGTLVEEQSMDQYMKTSSSREGNGRLPLLDTKVASSLVDISSSRTNTLYVISGSDAEALSSAMDARKLGDVTRGIRSRGTARIGLAAQHGFTYRPPGGQRFTCLVPSYDGESASIWQDLALDIMQAYRTRTNGAFTWRNASTCGFSYVQADPEFGDFQAKSLTTVLEAQLRSFPVQVVRESGSVFVAPEGVDKGAFVRRIMEGEEDYDFVLCIGDGLSDEKMFGVLKNVQAQQTKSTTKNQQIKNNSPNNSKGNGIRRSKRRNGIRKKQTICYSVTVNAKPSDAAWYVDNVSSVHDALSRLAASEKSGGMRRSFSTTSVDRRLGGGFSRGGSFGGDGSGGGGVGLLTKESMRGSRNNLETSPQGNGRRKANWGGVDTRTSMEGTAKRRETFNDVNALSMAQMSLNDGKETGDAPHGGSGGTQEQSKRKKLEKMESWSEKLWNAKWFILVAAVSLVLLRRRR
jgi:trehalose 6-phosphate synthase/phosphatase